MRPIFVEERVQKELKTAEAVVEGQGVVGPKDMGSIPSCHVDTVVKFFAYFCSGTTGLWYQVTQSARKILLSITAPKRDRRPGVYIQFQ